MSTDYRGAAAVVTGAASGIGRATALALAARGADVALADINEERLTVVAEEVRRLGRRALPIVCDVRDDADVEGLAARTLQELGRADVVMANAGVAVRGAVEEIGMDDWEWIVQINLLGVVRTVRAFLPHLIEHGRGHIVLTSSIGGLAASTIGAPYVATKHAVVGFGESLSLYLRPKGIGVTVLCPGGVATNIFESLRRAGTNPAMWGYGADPANPPSPAALARLQQPEQVAEILLDAMDEGRFVVPTTELRGPMADVAGAIERLVATAGVH